MTLAQLSLLIRLFGPDAKVVDLPSWAHRLR